MALLISNRNDVYDTGLTAVRGKRPLGEGIFRLEQNARLGNFLKLLIGRNKCPKLVAGGLSNSEVPARFS